jgi:membrane fusion protein (multidrug efflux system)
MNGPDRIQGAFTGVSQADRPRPARAFSLKGAAGKFAIGGVSLVVLVAAAVAGEGYWTTGRFVQTTDDAYVKADSTIVAPKISGYIASLFVDDNQAVKAGQALVRIDDRDYRTALGEADANVAAATAAVANLDAQIAAQASRIREADASVISAQASLSLSQRNSQRRLTMAKVGFGSVEQADDATTDAQEKTAALTSFQAAAATARQQVQVLTAQRALAQAQVARSEAQRDQARLNLGYTDIVAPIDGTVGARSTRVGQYVQAGTQLMALVPMRHVYVVANYKETQLTRVRKGQSARIEVDTFPGDEIQGQVESLAPASGLEFSLLPPDNATGNFTKIVQRIPVKIAVPANSPLLGRLRPGMSVKVSIDTKGVDPHPVVAAN